LQNRVDEVTVDVLICCTKGGTVMGVKRTTIELDEGQLRLAQEALGTSGIKDTVDEALKRAIRLYSLERLAESVAASEYAERPDDLRREGWSRG